MRLISLFSELFGKYGDLYHYDNSDLCEHNIKECRNIHAPYTMDVQFPKLLKCGSLYIREAENVWMPKLSESKFIAAPKMLIADFPKLVEGCKLHFNSAAVVELPKWKSNAAILAFNATYIVAPKAKGKIYCPEDADVYAPHATVKRGRWVSNGVTVMKIAKQKGYLYQLVADDDGKISYAVRTPDGNIFCGATIMQARDILAYEMSIQNKRSFGGPINYKTRADFFQRQMN